MFLLNSPSIAMPRVGRRTRPALGAAALALVVFVAACSDTTGVSRLVAPSGAASRSESPGRLLSAQGLLRTEPLAQNVVVVKTLSRRGGGISVPGTDFQLQVPNGAFAEESMTFTITAYAGNVVAYDFQPHGVTFLKPLQAVQKLVHTNWKSLRLPAGVYPSGAYFANVSQVDMISGKALVDEFMSTEFTVGGATMSWSIPHFSGYLVAAGRQDADDGSY